MKLHINVNTVWLPLFRKVLLANLLGQAHVNICIALFCGIVTFLSGIEMATEHEVIIIITVVGTHDNYVYYYMSRSSVW